MLPGEIVDQTYRLIRKIGEGGMGSVWHARHEMLEAEVALKVLRADLLSDLALKRFLREANIAAKIAHPNVVSITHVGRSESGGPYMVMEYLQGESLGDRLEREGVLSEEVALKLVTNVLHGLDAVHAHGVIHRDIKPENIFLPRGGSPKLLDFGISTMDGPEAQRLTQTGTLLGTPLYMSPEQARGHRELDARSDIWSLGIVLFEMLTSQMPYEGNTVIDLLVQVASGRPKDLRVLAPNLSPATHAIVARALSKEPGDRYPTANAMLRAVERAQRKFGGWVTSAELTTPGEFVTGELAVGERVAAPLDDDGTTAEFVNRSPGRRPRWLGGAMVASAAVVLLAGVLWFLQEDPAEDLPVAPVADRVVAPEPSSEDPAPPAPEEIQGAATPQIGPTVSATSPATAMTAPTATVMAPRGATVMAPSEPTAMAPEPTVMAPRGAPTATPPDAPGFQDGMSAETSMREPGFAYELDY